MLNDSATFVVSPVAGVIPMLPPLLSNNPTTWFTRVEVQFINQGITVQETELAHIVVTLQPEIV